MYYTGTLSDCLDPYDISIYYIIAFPADSGVCYVNHYLASAGIIPINIAGHRWFINGGPDTINQIFNPEIQVRFIAIPPIYIGSIEETVDICIYHFNLIAPVKIWPKPGDAAKDGMQDLEIFYYCLS